MKILLSLILAGVAGLNNAYADSAYNCQAFTTRHSQADFQKTGSLVISLMMGESKSFSLEGRSFTSDISQVSEGKIWLRLTESIPGQDARLSEAQFAASDNLMVSLGSMNGSGTNTSSSYITVSCQQGS